MRLHGIFTFQAVIGVVFGSHAVESGLASAENCSTQCLKVGLTSSTSMLQHGGTKWENALIVEDVNAVILRAGNEERDDERLRILQALQGNPGLDDTTRVDLDRFVQFVDMWVNGERLEFFWKEVQDTYDYDFGLSDGSKFEALAKIFLARMLFWVPTEVPPLRDDPNFFPRAIDLFKTAIETFPENRILKMYLGEPIENLDAPSDYTPVPNGAEWINDVRAGIEGFAKVIEYQVERQTTTGHFRGEWDDDCEMWRWWVPILIGFKVPKMEKVQAKFSESLLAREKMKRGYTTHFYDVEHTAEPTGDTITPMLHLQPDSELWQKRALDLAKLAEDKLMGINDKGFHQFKSMYFSIDRVCDEPSCSWDTLQHIRYMQPLLVLWKQTDNPQARDISLKWLDAWLNASMSEENNKPKGIPPSAIRFPTGHAGKETGDWWAPETYYKYDGLYAWPQELSSILDAFVLAYHKTKNEKYVEPLRLMAAFWRSHKTEPHTDEGSNGWIAKRLDGSFRSSIAKYRQLTGSSEFNDIKSTNTDWRLSTAAKAFRNNFEAFTTEVRFTDRVLEFPYMLKQGRMVDWDVGDLRIKPQHDALYATITGDAGGFPIFPLNAVRWVTPPEDIAMRVPESGLQIFRAELFHFGESTRNMSAELLQLEVGEYVVTLRDGTTDLVTPKKLHVTGRTTVDFTLPPKMLCNLEVKKDNKKGR